MNPLFFLLMAGGAAVALGRNRKSRYPGLSCREAFGAPGEPGQPAYLTGGGPDIMLPGNVGVGPDGIYSNRCRPVQDADYEGAVEVYIDIRRMGRDGANFRAVLERVVIPAAVMSPSIMFAVEASTEDSSILGLVGDDYMRDVVRIWPDWTDGAPGAYNEPLATPMEIAKVFQYALLRVQEAIEFPYEGNNGYHWLPSCGLLEGGLFMPDPAFHAHLSAIEGASLQETLAYEGNSAWGYVDYLMRTKPGGQNWADASEKAHQYARKILTEMEPPCGLPGFFAKEDEWAPQLLLQYNYMAKRIHKWIVNEAGYDIPFKPEFGP